MLPLSVPGPADVRVVLDALLDAGPRVLHLIGAAEEIVLDVGGLLDRIEATRVRADEVVAATDRTRGDAATMLADLAPLSGRLEALLDCLEPLAARAVPPAEKLLPVLDHLAETTSPREVDAMVGLIDQLPLLSQRMETQVLPILETLGTVAPDLHDLLDVSQELNEMLGKLPGMRGIKKRVEEAQAEEQQEEGRA
ncbi:hypothetical protein I601_1941 [Nocardioides dokdonensis FR1436]|uniref:Uncharacterized protein n=2 Tax=Nocardioides TaxID=1839 RepID=A0A1A9GL12_9ACTN|nr:hypothetical protein I601_1941 [Nocardioides dokdonensis FR1436]